MQTWQRFTAITTGVLALHGATLWAVQNYRVRMDRPDKAPALLTRMVELPKPPEVTPPPPPPAPPPPPPKPLPKPLPNPAVVQPAAAPQPAPAPTPLPLAVNNPTPAPNAPTGSATPAPAAPLSATAAPPAAIAAAPAPVEPAPRPPAPPPAPPAPTPVVQLPYVDADHADNQYRASYPRISQRLREEGRVVLRVTVGPDGKPTSAVVSKSSGFPALDDAAKETVMRWRYRPGTRGGVNEAASVLVPVEFKLPD